MIEGGGEGREGRGCCFVWFYENEVNAIHSSTESVNMFQEDD